MSTIRVYAATTGECVAGHRRGEFDLQRERVGRDFTSGARFVLDEQLGEIRCFHPVAPGSEQAFYLAYDAEDEVSPMVMVETARELFADHDAWGIQPQVSTGPLLEAFTNGPGNASDITLPADSSVRFGVPEYEQAAALIEVARSRTDRPGVYVVAVSPDVEHLEYDLAVHVAEGYEDITELSG